MRPICRHSTMSVPMPTMSMMGLSFLACRAAAADLSKVREALYNPFSWRTFRSPETMPMPDLLADLTDAQREAVTHMEGPLLILAGAGSGKTRVITRRVAYLLQQGVRPGNILAITFTNKAAGEMRQRVEALLPGNRVWISTFHSLGARLLRQYGERLNLDRNFTIYDVDDRNKLVKLAIEDAGLDATRFTPDTIAGAISKAKNQLLSPERYAERHGD